MQSAYHLDEAPRDASPSTFGRSRENCAEKRVQPPADQRFLTLDRGRRGDEVRYSEFQERVRRFRGDSLIDLCAYILWDLWSRELAGFDSQDVALLRAYGGRISIIAATGEGAGRDEPRGGDLFRLAHEFLEVEEGTLEDEFQQNERHLLLQAWTKSQVLSQYELNEQCLREAMIARTLLRMMRSQWDITQADYNSVPRAWDLIRRVQGKSASLDPIGYLRRALRVEPEVLLRGAFLLFSLNVSGHGRLDLRRATVDGKLPATWNLDHEALALVAERLSIHREDLLRWEEEVVTQLPDALRKYAPSPLALFPMIQRRGRAAAPMGERGEYVNPCPGSALLAMQNVLLHALRDAESTSAGPFSVELGHALEDYLYEFFISVAGRENVIRVDELGKLTRRADIIVIAGTRAIVVECKSLLGSATAKSVGSAAESVSIWEKIHGAYEQCARTARDPAIWRADPRLTQVTDVVSIVCFDEILCLEGTAFNALAACAGITERLGIQRIETVTLQYLERMIGRYGVEWMIEMITAKWKEGRQGDDLTAFIAHRVAGPPSKVGRTPAHLLEAFRDLFPGLPA